MLESPRFPDCVSIHAVMVPFYKTGVIGLASGFKKKNREWAIGLHRFDFAHVGLDQESHEQLRRFFHANGGMEGEFRVKDASDYKTTLTDGVLLPVEDSMVTGGAGVGYGTRVFMASKAYVAGAKVSYRWLQKLVAGTFTVYRGASPLTVGVGAGNIGVDPNTGLITFVPDQSKTIGSHTPGADHVFVVSGGAFSPNVTVGQRVYLAGITGTAASILNGFSHEVTGVSTTTITIATNTVGLTASGGTAELYPQDSETLSIVTEFDVPCMFSSDEATFQVLDKNLVTLWYEWSGINLEEVRIPL